MIRIVIIEDLPMVLEGLRLIINSDKDFEIVKEYANGKQFTNDLDNIEADIVLTDIDMPVMNGITATKIALTKKPELKIIALSMYDDKKFYYEMVSAGAKGFILKQEPTDELKKAIREVYNGESYFSNDILRSVIIEMSGIEKEITEEKKNLLELSEREVDILQLICKGLNNKELAEKLFVSSRTIELAKTMLMKKTGTSNNAGLIIWAIKNKIVTI